MTKPRILLNPEPSNKSKGVTTQMKALEKYFLMVVFTLLLNRVHVFAIVVFNLDRKSLTVKGLNVIVVSSEETLLWLFYGMSIVCKNIAFFSLSGICYATLKLITYPSVVVRIHKRDWSLRELNDKRIVKPCHLLLHLIINFRRGHYRFCTVLKNKNPAVRESKFS